MSRDDTLRPARNPGLVDPERASQVDEEGEAVDPLEGRGFDTFSLTVAYKHTPVTVSRYEHDPDRVTLRIGDVEARATVAEAVQIAEHLAPAPPEKRAWALVHRARPVSANDYRARHWSKRHEHELEWRNAGFILATKIKLPRLRRVGIVVTPVGARWKQDTGNCFPSAKAFVDGLVDAAVIPDDTSAHVAYLTFHPWVDGPDDRLHFKIVDESE